MKISVNIVAFNAERFIAEAIESVLNQSFADYELIIVNDGSTDGTGDVIEKYIGDERIKYHRFENNLGVAKARNEALSKSKGEYIAVLDADDVSLPNRLELQCRFLDQNPDCVAVGANAEVIDADGNHVYTTDCLCSWDDIRNRLPGMPFFHSSVLFRRETADRIGGYPDIFPLADDLLLINMLADRGELRAVPDMLIKYRITPTSISRRSRRHEKILEKVLAKHLRSIPLTFWEQ